MKDINEKELQFVADRYEPDALDVEKALRRFQERAGIAPARSWRHIVAVVSMVMLVGGALACGLWYSQRQRAEVLTESVAPAPRYRILKAQGEQSVLLQYDNEPIGNVLRELSAYYGKRLSTKESHRRITGEIEATSLDEVIVILETTLHIKISVK